MKSLNSIKFNYYHVSFFFTIILLTTQARVALLFIAPFLVLLLIANLGLVFRKELFLLLAVLIFSYLVSLFNGFYFRYNLLSLFYIIPFLFLVFARPVKTAYGRDLLDIFFRMLAIVTIISDLIGFWQYIRFPNDDSFAGLYGHFTVTQNGLMIVNSILFYYYFRKYQLFRKKSQLWLFIFFLFSTIMGFYGAGIIVLGATLVAQMIKFDFKKIVKIFFIVAFGLLFIYVVMDWISPDTLRYNKNILRMFAGQKDYPVPRKLTSYSNYLHGYGSHIKDLVLGSGPGTFNSRSAFTVGSPEYFTAASFLKSTDKPFYFENYAYSLWNSGNTGRYQDGFRNQPFSSALAFLGEYGLFFSLLLAYYYFKQYKSVTGYPVYHPADLLARDLYKFLSILLVFLLIIDNYAEYPEITILLLLIMKIAEKELLKSQVQQSEHA